jgi:hypothetical protein
MYRGDDIHHTKIEKERKRVEDFLFKVAASNILVLQGEGALAVYM